MKAIVLAAGLGTRLRPMTDDLPKCLVPIRGKPLLGYWMESFARHGITHVLINTHHLPQKVEAFLSQLGAEIEISISHEPELLGSAGTVIANRSFIEDDEEFFVIYADNLTNIDLQAMLSRHRVMHSSFTVALYHTKTPEACGIVEMDKESVIRSFIEKPIRPRSDLANTGIYLTNGELFRHPLMMNENRPLDFGYHILPGLAGAMHGYVISEYLIDIGSPAQLARANETWPG